MVAKTVEKLLQEVGFSPKEQAVYLATLELGEAPVSPIARRAHINRGTAYDILKSLIEKGLVAKAEKGKILQFSALGAEALEIYLQAQKAEWESKLGTFRELQLELTALVGSAGIKPVVRLFEGKMGLKEVFLDQIRGEHKEILSYSAAAPAERVFGEYLRIFTKQKARAGIFTRMIVPDLKAVLAYGEKYYGKQFEKLFSIKAISPEKFPFEMEMNIYGNKLVMISFVEKEPVAVIIESPTLAKSQRLIFELLWEKLE